MKKVIHILNPLIVILTSWTYISILTHWQFNPPLSQIVFSQEMRPFVYRLLVPTLVRGVIFVFHFPVDHAVQMVYIFFALGFYFSAKYLISFFTHDSERAGLLAVLCHELIYVILFQDGKIYDMGTAFFFTLCLAFLARRQFIWYCIGFLFATLNRETTFILVIFFAIHFFTRIPFRKYFYLSVAQFLIYFLVRTFTMAIFADHPGAPLLFRPAQNIQMFLNNPLGTLIVLLSASLMLVLILHHWPWKPAFLRSAFMVMLPIQVLLHITMGWGLEMRIYAEIFPICIILGSPLLISNRIAGYDSPLLALKSEIEIVPAAGNFDSF